MVVPVGGGPQVDPGMMNDPEVQGHLAKAKWLVVGLWLGGFVELVINPMAALNTVLLSIFGTYLFKDDLHLGACYRFLERTPVKMCCQNQQTLQLLLPFCVLSAMNSFFDLFTIADGFSRLGFAPALHNVPFDIVLWVFLCETAASYFSLKALGILLPQQPTQLQQPLLGSGGYPAQNRMGGSAQGGGGPALGGAAPSFAAFQGQGRKLGS